MKLILLMQDPKDSSNRQWDVPDVKHIKRLSNGELKVVRDGKKTFRTNVPYLVED